MSKATYPLKLPLSVKEAAARLAKADGVSLNQWIASAVAQKVGAMETAADFLRRRAGDASAGDLGKMLERVAGGPPQAGDELPPDRH
ncbi:pilus assembly protein HicB [Mesorhizobium sp. M0088]|uniref:pilus assembly protein HicB n=1 Tax=Mesorhizobium sp. M0088 TaxID=2956873 RepID=UPI00333AF3D6